MKTVERLKILKDKIEHYQKDNIGGYDVQTLKLAIQALESKTPYVRLLEIAKDMKGWAGTIEKSI